MSMAKRKPKLTMISCLPVLQLGSDFIAARESVTIHVRLLGVTLSFRLTSASTDTSPSSAQGIKAKAKNLDFGLKDQGQKV